jgi:ubiquinone/menaquinone biosynthesis C-methylase UbiE
MKNSQKDKIKSGYKKISNIYDDYITGKWLWSKIFTKIIWGFNDKAYSEKFLENIPDSFSGRILDVPAGTGVLTFEKYKKLTNAEILCMDYSGDMLEIAKARFLKNGIKNVECIQGDVGHIPFESETFDIALSMNGFHAFPEKEQAFGEIHRILKTGGFFIGCFYIKGQVKRTDWFVKRLFVPSGTFTLPFYNKTELQDILQKQYKEIELWTIGSIACFKCVK